MKNSLKKSLLICFILLIQLGVNALKHRLSVTNEKRQRFFVESFGFEAGGVVEVDFQNIKLGEIAGVDKEKIQAGIVVEISSTDSNLLLDDLQGEFDACSELQNDENLPMILDGAAFKSQVKIPDGKEGFYDIYFCVCFNKETVQPLSFDLDLMLYNIDDEGTRNYLPAGASPLPTIYALFTVTYVGVLFVWVLFFLRAKDAKINRLHHLMTSLVVLKLLSLLFKALEEHYLKVNGTAIGWNVMYYIFAGLKGVMLFTILALLGTGWTFIKPFLSDKDKKIFLIVIPLQILDNIALIIIEETTPGSQGWFTWKDIFRLVDILCCGAILIPIVWSIKHLKEASKTDGKVAINMNKLQMFRQFYLLVVSYIYFTRIIVYLVDATLPFRWVWLGDFFTEFSSLLFFGVTGYIFRPVAENPYFKMRDEDENMNNTVSVPLEIIEDSSPNSKLEDP